MIVTRVESLVVRVPLERPVLLATESFSARDFNVVRIQTDEGVVGVGYGRGGRLVHAALELEVAPLLMGRDPLATEAIWSDVYRRTALVGRRGVLVRALSIADIALWDVKAKALGKPLFRLLGGECSEVRAYVSGGYYREGQSPADLAAELSGYVERGFRAVKMRVGRLTVAEDEARVAAARAAIGDDVELMVDANQGYASAAEAIRAGRAFEAHGVRWLEEPLSPDDLTGSAQVAVALDLPIAGGEVETTRFAFRDIIERRALDILQPDVTVVGGITEWLKVAALASAAHLPLAPHYFFEVHAQLAAATPATIYVEYFFPDADIITFDPLLLEPLQPRDGRLQLPERPGVGLELREEAIQRYRVA